MQITRGNYSQYANMVQQMFGNKKNPNNPLAQCDYGNFALRFKPVDIQFTKPNWDNIMMFTSTRAIGSFGNTLIAGDLKPTADGKGKALLVASRFW